MLKDVTGANLEAAGKYRLSGTGSTAGNERTPPVVLIVVSKPVVPKGEKLSGYVRVLVYVFKMNRCPKLAFICNKGNDMVRGTEFRVPELNAASDMAM